VAHPGLDVDLWQLDAHLEAAARAGAAGDQIASALSAAAALWPGEPLVDLQDVEEMSGEVTRVRTALIDPTLALGEARLSDGRAADSVRSAQAVLAADAYNERAHRLAIATQIHLGDHKAANQAARRMSEALTEVGAAPSDTTKILLRRMATFGAAR
jgi:DNA-binding SARP family transcriptional activator